TDVPEGVALGLRRIRVLGVSDQGARGVVEHPTFAAEAAQSRDVDHPAAATPGGANRIVTDRAADDGVDQDLHVHGAACVPFERGAASPMHDGAAVLQMTRWSSTPRR